MEGWKKWVVGREKGVGVNWVVKRMGMGDVGMRGEWEKEVGGMEGGEVWEERLGKEIEG